ncbi:hypothetical protein Peur_016504 [Populus x canadensis]
MIIRLLYVTYQLQFLQSSLLWTEVQLLENPLVNTSQQTQVPGTFNLLALGPPRSSTSGSQSSG